MANPTAVPDKLSTDTPSPAGDLVGSINVADMVFTTLRFAGLYLLSGILFVYLVMQEPNRCATTAPVTAH